MSIFFYTKSALLDSLEKYVLKSVTQHVTDVTMSMAGVNTVVIHSGWKGLYCQARNVSNKAKRNLK